MNRYSDEEIFKQACKLHKILSPAEIDAICDAFGIRSSYDCDSLEMQALAAYIDKFIAWKESKHGK